MATSGFLQKQAQLQVALYEPQIPQNCGNIARSCSVSGVPLTLLGSLGFRLGEKEMRRAGLDYWDQLLFCHEEEALTWLERHLKRLVFFTSKGVKPYWEHRFASDDILLFGSETSGLPSFLHERIENDAALQKRALRIPMVAKPRARCLNLATSVGIGLYEALRQIETGKGA